MMVSQRLLLPSMRCIRDLPATYAVTGWSATPILGFNAFTSLRANRLRGWRGRRWHVRAAQIQIELIDDLRQHAGAIRIGPFGPGGAWHEQSTGAKDFLRMPPNHLGHDLNQTGLFLVHARALQNSLLRLEHDPAIRAAKRIIERTH